MSRIAIIDTAVDPNSVKNGTFVEYINLCGGEDSHGHEFGHGTVCAMVLDHCASDYELVNIRIFEENGSKVYGQIELLAEALKLCGELRIDVVSLSALNNKHFMTVPTCYHHVIGVRSDVAGVLSSGELAYSVNDPFNANVIVNCSFAFLQP